MDGLRNIVVQNRLKGMDGCGYHGTSIPTFHTHSISDPPRAPDEDCSSLLSHVNQGCLLIVEPLVMKQTTRNLHSSCAVLPHESEGIV